MYLKNESPDEEDIEEATGNEGATIDRLYNKAAIVFWPSSKEYSVFVLSDELGGIPTLRESVSKVVKSGRKKKIKRI